MRFRLHKPKPSDCSNNDGSVILILYNRRTIWWESELSFIRYSWRCHRLTNFKLMTFLLNCLRRGIFRIPENQTSKNRFSEMVLRYAGNFHYDHFMFDPCFHHLLSFIMMFIYLFIYSFIYLFIHFFILSLYCIKKVTHIVFKIKRQHCIFLVCCKIQNSF